MHIYTLSKVGPKKKLRIVVCFKIIPQAVYFQNFQRGSEVKLFFIYRNFLIHCFPEMCLYIKITFQITKVLKALK